MVRSCSRGRRPASVRGAVRLRKCRNRHRGNDRFSADRGVIHLPLSEPHRGHHHRRVLDRGHPRRGDLVRRSSARPREPLEEDRTETWSRRETTWLVIMIIVLFALLMGTIFYVPYGDSAGPQRAVRAGHRRAVRLGDPGAADARHGTSRRVPRPLRRRRARLRRLQPRRRPHLPGPGRARSRAEDRPHVHPAGPLHRSLPRVLWRRASPDEGDVRR